MRHHRRLLTSVVRVSLGLALALLFFPPFPSRAESPPTPPPAGQQLAEDTPLLTEAGGVAQGELYQGAAVKVLEEGDGWVKVSVTGWVPKASLVAPRPEADSSAGAEAPAAESEQAAMGAEDGFRFQNVAFRPTYGFTKVIGEVQNLTPSSYSVATFTLTVYDASGAIAAVDHLVVSNLKPFGTKTFEALIDAELPEGAKYKIQFDAAF